MKKSCLPQFGPQSAESAGRVNKANLRNISPVLAVGIWRSHMVYVFNL